LLTDSELHGSAQLPLLCTSHDQAFRTTLFEDLAIQR